MTASEIEPDLPKTEICGGEQTALLGAAWLLKVPVGLRPILTAGLSDTTLYFPSVVQDDGTVTDIVPDRLVQRILASGPGAVGLWSDIALKPEHAQALHAQGRRLLRLGPARLWGPMPEPGYLCEPYGVTLRPDDAPLAALRPTEDEQTQLLASYRRLALTAVNEAGKLALPLQAHQLIKRPCVLVVADDEHDQATTPGNLREWRNLLIRARYENPDQTITFLTNGRPLPKSDEAELVAEICAIADIICSERWSLAFLPFCTAVYTRRATAGLDAALADIRVVISEPGPLQQFAEGRITAKAALSEHLLQDTLFGDPLHGAPIPRGIILDVIAARKNLLPEAALPAARRWPMAAARPAPTSTVSIATSACYSEVNQEKVLPVPQNLIAPHWLTLDVADRPQGDILMLQGECDLLPALQREPATVSFRVAELTLHPSGDLNALADFAQYQPVLFLKVIRQRIRRSGLRKALIVDISSPAVRLFARACALEGVDRAYLPGHQGLPVAATSLSSLCDSAFFWHPDQNELVLKEDCFDVDRIRPVHLDIPRTTSTRVTLWLERTGLSAGRLRALISEALETAHLMEHPILFALGQDTLALLDEKSLDRIRHDDLAEYRLVGIGNDDSMEILAQSGLVLAQSQRIHALAGQMGCQLAPLVPDSTKPVDPTDLRVHLSGRILDYLDTLDEPVSPAANHQGFKDTPMLGQVLRDWVAAPVPKRDAVFRPRRTPFALSVFDKSSLSAEARYFPTLMGVTAITADGRLFSPHDFIDLDVFFQWGLRTNSRKNRSINGTRDLNVPLVYLEDGFIRSVAIGLTKEPGLSICFDSKTPFYDATQPSQLEDWINQDHPLTDAQIARARALIDRITTNKITKYNFAPYRRIRRDDPTRGVILVVDQRAGDMSIEKGLASEETFARMVERALEFADGHDILIKTHPDANIGGKSSAIGAETLQRAAEHPAVTLVTADMNPYSLIDIADKVFVVSSGMGFEALMAGKEVWCFGAPFYAGWGLTQDQLSLPRRTARPDLAALFHAFYIEHSRYYDPISGTPGEVEATIDYILLQRPWSLQRCLHPAALLDLSPPAPPAPLVPALSSYQTLWIFGVSKWKQDFITTVFSAGDVQFGDDWRDFNKIIVSEAPAILVWGYKSVAGLAAFAQRNGIPIYRIEDGFLRSVGLGADHILPYSLCVDGRGLYFDSRHPSDLEHLLQTHDFAADPALLTRARLLRERIVATGLSKHNFPAPRQNEPYGPKARRRVLVIGQVEDDASIRFGAPEPVTNNDLVRLARQENPDAQVIYRIHPDVLEGKRDGFSDPADVAAICEISASRLALADAFDGVDQVYTITSLAGFEALMRGIPVTTVGMPFYAGWGLTDDRASCPRRNRRLSLDELFAGAYMLYPHYFDPETGTVLDIAQVIDQLLRELQVQRLAEV